MAQAQTVPSLSLKRLPRSGADGSVELVKGVVYRIIIVCQNRIEQQFFI